MMKLHPVAAALTIAVLLAGVLRRSGYSSHGPIDIILLVLFLILFWWLISDFSGGKVNIDADGRQNGDNGIAFRFGRVSESHFSAQAQSLTQQIGSSEISAHMGNISEI